MNDGLVPVAICILTYRRPELLRRALDGVNRLVFERMPHCRPAIIVVENEDGGPGAAVCANAQLRFPLRYLSELRPGVSHARNCALQAALPSYEFIAFLDDDETPDAHWLDRLLAAASSYQADAVGGPVLPVYTLPPPPWILEGRFFDRPRYSTGNAVSCAITANVLLRTSTIRRLNLNFDAAFSTSGGEDTEFFTRLHRTGGRIVWADDACVYETVPPERASLRWLLRRAFQGGNAFTHVRLSVEPGWKSYSARAISAVLRILAGLAAVPVAACSGRSSLVKTLQSIAIGIGGFAGLAGYRLCSYPGASKKRRSTVMPASR